MVREAHEQHHAPPPGRRVRHAGFVMGAGFAALLDGILFHDLLRWHHLVEGSEVSDGILLALGWAATLAGLWLLWGARFRLAAPGSGRRLGGSLVVGGATFNVVEGIVDHHVLGVHHVYPFANALAWDLAFLAVNLALALVGLRMLATAAVADATRRRKVRSRA